MKQNKSSLSACTKLALLLITVFFLGCRHVPKEKQHPVNFPSKEYTLYAKDVSGICYSWKLLTCIPISTPRYSEAINEIWDKSEIPMKDRKNYVLVNIKQRYGTDWSILLIGENYLSVTADIAELNH